VQRYFYVPEDDFAKQEKQFGYLVLTHLILPLVLVFEATTLGGVM
jgi:hypothetical protein